MNDVTVKEETNVATYDPNVLGAVDDVTGTDIKIGRISCVTSMSKAFTEEKSKLGEIIDHETFEVFGNEKKACEIILLNSEKVWRSKNTKTKEYLGTTKAMHQREMPWKDGDIENVYTHSLNVILPSQIKNKSDVPYQVSFSKTSLSCVQKLSKWLLAMSRNKEASWNRTFKLVSAKRKNDQGTWHGFDIEVGRETTKEERMMAYQWYDTITKSDNVEVSSYEESNADATMANTKPQF